MELIADIDLISAGGGAGGIITIIGALWVIVRQFRKDVADGRAAEKKENDAAEKVKRVDAIAELSGLLDRQQLDFDTYKKETKAELKEIREELCESEARSHECDRKSDRMAAHIFYLEDTLRRSPGVADFRPWSEVSGSGAHAPLKESKP